MAKPQKPKAVDTVTSTSERIARNDEREQDLARRGGMLDPTGLMMLRIEEFIKVALGERQYLTYVNGFQDVREKLLDELEAAIRQAEITRGIQLVGTSGETLLGGKK